MSQDDKMSVFQASVQNFLGPILNLLNNPEVSEILINSHDEIFVETKGRMKRTKARFPSEDDLRAAVNNIAQSVGRRVDRENPRLDARLPDGSRIAAVIPPCSRKGTTVSIRKFTNNRIDLKQYIQLGAITQDAAQFLDICMYMGKNILVSGGTGSGKTTLLNLLCSRIPSGQRVIVIEDSSELDIDYEHVVMFETQMPDAEGKGGVSIQDLLKSSLRLRPDRIIVGEVRGSEALELINAMNTGHKGCMGTIHANTPKDAIVRLEALAQGAGAALSEKALQYQVGSAIDLIVQVTRFHDGSRKIASIAEVLGVDPGGTYHVENIFHLEKMTRMPDGTFKGDMSPTGYIPSFMDEISDFRLPFSKEKLRKAS